VDTWLTQQLKFSILYTWAQHNLPETALQVTWSKSGTYITPSGQHGTINPAPITQHKWNEPQQTYPPINIGYLHTWTCSTMVNLCGQPSRQVRHVPSVMAPLKSSLAQQHGYFTMAKQMPHWIGTTCHPRIFRRPMFYQSKLSGIYGIAATIQELSLYHDLGGVQSPSFVMERVPSIDVSSCGQAIP